MKLFAIRNAVFDKYGKASRTSVIRPDMSLQGALAHPPFDTKPIILQCGNFLAPQHLTQNPKKTAQKVAPLMVFRLIFLYVLGKLLKSNIALVQFKKFEVEAVRHVTGKKNHVLACGFAYQTFHKG